MGRVKRLRGDGSWIVCVLLLAGACSKPEDPAPAATPAPRPSATPLPSPMADQVAPSIASATPPPSPFPRLPGIGATRADWEATHTRYLDGAVTPGAVFGPKSVGGRSATYSVVDGDYRILGYHLVMAPTTFEQARLRLISELPADAREVKRRVLRGCQQIRYRSATLDAIFRDDPVAHATGYGGQVEVEFVSEDPEVMNPAAVTEVVVGEEADC